MKEPNKPRSRRRRALIALLGGAAAMAGTPVRALAAPACVLSPRQSEGPYFLDARLNRSDVRRDSATGALREGRPLQLRLRVVQADGGCRPLAGTAVEIWHCDAKGAYSGVDDRHSGAVQGDFLRGYQITDAQGLVRFTTIYPGWYPGRAVHIHVKLRQPESGAGASEWTSQLYFDDNTTAHAYTHPAYLRSGQVPRNQDDWLFRRGGRDLMLTLARADAGYVASFEMGVRGVRTN